MLSKHIKNFCSKMRKEEILLYIMNDKYSVKPDKEFRINHQTVENIDGNKKSKTVILYGRMC